jgi:hypothetical protein
MSKIATSDGYVTVKIQPISGDPIPIRRRVVKGTVIPDWLDVEGAELDADVKEVEPGDIAPQKSKVYTRAGVEEVPPTSGEPEAEDELADTPAPAPKHRTRKAAEG